MTTVAGRPAIALRAGGAPLPVAYGRAIAELRVAQVLSLPSQCELVLADPDAALDAATALGPGTALDVLLGGFAEPLFEGEVTGLEFVYGPAGERELRVRAYDLLHRLRRRHAVRAYAEVTPRSLAAELVADLGLSVDAVEAGPLRQHVLQAGRSDLDLLRDVAEPCGLYPTLRGRTLRLVTLAGHGEPLPLTLGASLLEARFDASIEPARDAVTGWAWNPRSGETFRARSDEPRDGRSVPERVGSRRRGRDGDHVLVDRVVGGRPEADALPQAELDRRSAGALTFWGVAEGDPGLRPAARVDLRGVDRALAGRYVLASVVHTIDARGGYQSELSTAPPVPPPTRRGGSAVLGVVTRVDDPAGLGRVRVALPTFDDAETDWLQVLSLGAGAGKGLMILPDRGDHVVVLTTEGDPGQGIVLGGLRGQDGWHDAGVEGTAVRRFTLRTPGGQWLRLDDGENGLTLGDATGSHIELSPRRVRLHAAVDLEIEAPGRRVIVRGDAIDFERG